MSAPARPSIEAIEEPASALPESDIAREANALDAAIAPDRGEICRSPYVAPSSAPSPPAAPSASPPGGKPGASPPPSPKPGAPTGARPARRFPAPRLRPDPQSAPMAGSPRSVARAASPTAVPEPGGQRRRAEPWSTVRPLRTPVAQHAPHPRLCAAGLGGDTRRLAPAGKLAAAAAPEAPPGRPQAPPLAGARPASSLGRRASAASPRAIGTKASGGQFPAAARSR